MRMILISDNIDTSMGLRLAGIEGVVVHDKDEVLKTLDDYAHQDDIAIVLMTTNIVNLCPEIISDLKLKMSKPLLVEIPDRHGSIKIGETIDSYISEAIGVKLGGD
ncbi:V-type ATP synthase subunit F [bioreactor metagenome]|uniref:V-type ATP synthase subunit F n=1 Tax=bioreactor metagenome TaxID=1076179 RepID=A0A644YDW4_9ZZZZ